MGFYYSRIIFGIQTQGTGINFGVIVNSIKRFIKLVTDKCVIFQVSSNGVRRMLHRRNCSIEKASNEIKIPMPSMKKALAKSLRFKDRSIFDLFLADSQGDEFPRKYFLRQCSTSLVWYSSRILKSIKCQSCVSNNSLDAETCTLDLSNFCAGSSF